MKLKQLCDNLRKKLIDYFTRFIQEMHMPALKLQQSEFVLQLRIYDRVMSSFCPTNKRFPDRYK